MPKCTDLHDTPFQCFPPNFRYSRGWGVSQYDKHFTITIGKVVLCSIISYENPSSVHFGEASSFTVKILILSGDHVKVVGVFFVKVVIIKCRVKSLPFPRIHTKH